MKICNMSSISFTILSLISIFINPAISSRVSSSSSFIKLPTSSSSIESRSSFADYCESWRLAVETNNAGTWKFVPSQCENYVKKYIVGGQFDNDYDVLVSYAISYAKTIELAGNGMDAWVFDIDETLLSNFEYYKAHGYGSEPFDNTQFNEWVAKGMAPPFEASLRLYKALKKLGFTIILLTGRDESQRNITLQNLRYAGYFGWNRLLLRGDEDQGKTAVQYKSEQRSKVVEEGYTIHGSTGDQWSDLLGFSVATRSFKVPNPLYYVP